MSKTKSFVDKQAERKQYYESYNKAILYAYKTELLKKKETELEQFALNHSKEEIAKQDKFLDKIIDDELLNKKNKLEAKSKSKLDKYEKKNSVNSTRIWEIDFVRGIVIIGMLIDHFFFDFLGIFTKYNFTNLPQFYLDIGSFAHLYWVHPVRVAFRLVGLFFLLFVSGISTHFSRNSIRRSLIVIGAGIIISVAFLIVAKVTNSMDDLVLMGAVLCIGVCMLIYSLYRWITFKIPHNDVWRKWVTLAIALAILISWVFISYNAATDKSNFWFYYNGYAGSIKVVTFKDLVPNLGKVLLGTVYFGSDWMGLFPALGYLFLGAFVGETVYKNRKSIFRRFNEKLNKNTLAIVVPGRYSLWFYLIHQPVYIIIIGVIALIMGAGFNI